MQTLTSFAGKVAPERALLDRQRVSQFVTGKVLSWAGMGCMASDVSRMLAEDAAEVRLLLQGMDISLHFVSACCNIAWLVAVFLPLQVCCPVWIHVLAGPLAVEHDSTTQSG